MSTERLEQQIRFIAELDKLKGVLRRTLLMDGSRAENSAEHSWHLAVMAILLQDYARETVDLIRVLKLVLVHDVVEIDAGDTYCYDEAANEGRVEREKKAAERLFDLLPADQAAELHTLWNEFEACETPEARFAAALDRLQPLLQNYRTQGASWQRHGVVRGQVIRRNGTMADGAPRLWEYALGLIDDAVKQGFLATEPEGT